MPHILTHMFQRFRFRIFRLKKVALLLLRVFRSSFLCCISLFVFYTVIFCGALMAAFFKYDLNAPYPVLV